MNASRSRGAGRFARTGPLAEHRENRGVCRERCSGNET
jgi:hypothetical protein